MANDPASSPSCTGDCGHCAIGQATGAQAPAGPLRGGSMAAAAAMFFGPPLIGAVAGAVAGQMLWAGELLGAVVGLAGGAMVSMAAGRVVNRRCEAQP